MRSLAPCTPLILVLGTPSGMVLVRGSMHNGLSKLRHTLWFCRHFNRRLPLFLRQRYLTQDTIGTLLDPTYRQTELQNDHHTSNP